MRYVKPILFVLTIALLSSCQDKPSTDYLTLQGEAQGTTYTITYLHPEKTDLQVAVDSLFEVIDLSLSTYRDNSTITRFNQQDSLQSSDLHFLNVLEASRKVFQLSLGAFDPTVMPLVRAWGFGPDGAALRSSNLDSLRQFVGLNGILNSPPSPTAPYTISKQRSGMQLDFNAIAPGYSVDQLGLLLQNRGATDYLIEVGGEVVAHGQSPRGQAWRIGVDKPEENPEQRELVAVIELHEGALATSGSYRKYYVRDGVKYSHTIDPKTGVPVAHTLLSVTVLAGDATTADAMATAFMVWGELEAQVFISRHPELGLEAYFITSDEQGELAFSATPGMESLIRALP